MIRRWSNLFVLYLIIGSCIDRIEFDIGDLNKGVLVVDGNITDQPGPYTIRLLRSSNTNDVLNFSTPFNVRQVTLLDDVGNSEILTSQGSGEFHTKEGGIQGVIGRSYSLRIDLINGDVVESEPEEIKPPSNFDSLYYEFESEEQLDSPPKRGFRVFVDASGAQSNENFIRWRYTGTYKVLTYPELHTIRCPDLGVNPLPCSGYIRKGDELPIRIKVGDCTCCYCWVNNYENRPHLSDDVVVTNGTFKKVEVGFAPFDEWTFAQNKYMIKVEQMSLTRKAFEYWKVYRDQKEGVTSLFQPAFGKARTNFKPVKGQQEVVGMFYASSVKKKIIFITGKDAPISVPQQAIPPLENCPLWDACDNIYYNAFRYPPSEWE